MKLETERKEREWERDRKRIGRDKGGEEKKMRNREGDRERYWEGEN